MKKKGFTLIELLAVIVILAIIALIATPLVLKYIEKSRKESKVDSAYSFVRNLETEIANYAIKNNGKKYTTDKESIKELGLDITVKGENPEDGKVCISNVGQVEKGVFQYGKYYVSYDGKKGSISDKDTYDNFSCSGNGGNNLEDILFETDVVFVDGTAASLDIDKTIFDKFDKPSHEYKVVIDDKYEFITFAVKLVDIGIFQMASDELFLGAEGDKGVSVAFTENKFQAFTNFVLENPSEPHNIKIYYPKETTNNFLFEITNDYLDIIDYDFVSGNALMLIKDETGYEYFSGNIEIKDNMGYGLYGIDDGCRHNIEEMPELYEAIAQGKKITITVTQSVDGKDVITTIDTSNIKKVPNYDAYYMGRYMLVAGTSC